MNNYYDNPKFALLTELPYSATRREHKSNCKSCGAPIPANGVCEYCGTDNILETRNIVSDAHDFSVYSSGSSADYEIM